ncbi:Sjogren's syndrome/scleroderma autoantigen 1 family protein [Halorussus salinisoli]|uniref:Sjogren's syndrome/scleroderma autoantigen 1 family protein n=1 Tax=Halorussus salinisoli TaxID=2558242 RepID=UPI0010C1F995|nr:Sjogren's syndrome/scleroderma autoantigen 1 family protein [Halorussus salinisoli]
MSSDDSGFDKEAEREKLREKYGDEEDDRENTRRMSELLLQGATMTGKHCDNCGDPIFRYDGQEFCPTCQHEARAQAQSQNGEPGDQSQQAAGTDETGERAAADADRDVDADESESADGSPETDDEPRVEIDDVRVADRHADRSNVRRPPSQTDSGRRDDSRRGSHDRAGRHAHDHAGHDHGTHDRARGRERAGSGGERGRDTGERTGDAKLGAARDALVRKLTDLAREAEATDDVARARDLLAATREAAEALAALDRANR